jgi:hypothetical protein
LKLEIARSRELVARNLRAVRHDLDFPGKIRRSFQRQTVGWIAAAVVVGILLVVLPRRTKKIEVVAKIPGAKPTSKLLEAGFAMAALKFALALLRPTITSFVAKKLSGLGNQQSATKKW